MSDATGGRVPARPRLKGWSNRVIASPGFQRWAARFPLTRRMVRRDGEALFDLVAGFCHSQVLQAFVRLGIPSKMMDGPVPLATLSHRTRVPEARLQVLLRAATALNLVRQRGDAFALTRKGAALKGVPGLAEMIAHHQVLYRDLADPVAFFRGEAETELQHFWPYVFGADGDPETAKRYSQLMADSLSTVADDVLDTVLLRDGQRLLDIGGGTGAFLAAAGAKWPHLQLDLFDLPSVAPAAQQRFADAGLTGRATIHSGNFRTDSLPSGADMISLVRVLYDHSDDTVMALLAKVFAALPRGGRLIVAEPMLGATRPERAGDAYFALYTLAMGTGSTRSAPEIATLLENAGFAEIRPLRPRRAFVTSVVTAVRAG